MPVTLLCRHCGSPFQVKKHLEHTALYCSRPCYDAVRILSWVTRHCPECDTDFQVAPLIQLQRRQIYCSRACATAVAGRARRGKNLQRFWSRVAQCAHGYDCIYCCWNWGGTKSPKGYGKIVLSGGKQTFAHRVAWRLHHQLSLPDTSVVAHYCNNTSCANPGHLHAGTHQDNSDDMVRDKRQTFGERNRQHKLTEDQIREIFRLRQEGWTLEAIAKPLGVTFQTIHKIVTGARWAHLDRPDLPTFKPGRRPR